MTTTAEILGNATPGSFSTLQADLVRLRRTWDMDDEDRQSRGTGLYPHPDIIRVRLIDELLDYLRPAVEAEAARWDAQEAELDRVKEMEHLHGHRMPRRPGGYYEPEIPSGHPDAVIGSDQWKALHGADEPSR